MKKILWIFLIPAFTSKAQSYTIDTLPNAVAYVNAFTPLSLYGIANNGNYYTAGFIQHYDDYGRGSEVDFVRINLTTKQVAYKRLPKVFSGNGFYWIYTFDREGNLYLSMNTANRKIIRLSLKDSIAFSDLGNPFINATTLAYSASPGRDNNLYFGGSSGGTYWSMYNTKTKIFDKHPVVDPDNDYVLSIAGDNDYVYLQIGQRKNIRLWAVNKATNEKKILFTVPNTTRISLGAFTDAIYAGISVDTLKATFRLVHGEALKINPSELVEHSAISGDYEPGTQNKKKPTTFFDPVTSQLFFSFDDKNFDNVTINAGSFKTAVRRIFSFPGDADNIYYVGDYYGNYYRYNLKEKKSYLLGSTAYNAYSFLPVNNNLTYIGGYPSGFLMLWDKSKPWTTQRFVNGKFIDAFRDKDANPKLLHYWKSEGNPAAGFHHTMQLLNDNKGNIIGAGDVIRIGNAASIGVYNPSRNSLYGISYQPYSLFQFAGIALWHDLIVYGMRNMSNKMPKLYFYDATANIMKDSIDLGFYDYGKIYIQGNILTGFANNRMYSYDLKHHKLLYNYKFNDNTVGESIMLHNGNFAVNTTNKIPAELKNITVIPFGNYHEANNIIYATTGKSIVRINLK